jgi:hypothetical protein
MSYRFAYLAAIIGSVLARRTRGGTPRSCGHLAWHVTLPGAPIGLS